MAAGGAAVGEEEELVMLIDMVMRQRPGQGGRGAMLGRGSASDGDGGRGRHRFAPEVMMMTGQGGDAGRGGRCLLPPRYGAFERRTALCLLVSLLLVRLLLAGLPARNTRQVGLVAPAACGA